ncbi:MAG: 16S rRNA (guanine(527)-N(7))-methyltransferase RsmG [Flavobacteriales bacterium]
MSLIKKYFPEINKTHLEKLNELVPLYKEWNERINVVSRKDIDQLELHHVLHSLAIARRTKFNPGAKILDIGTGGGFPGLPLAILFEDTQFHLVDSIGKKLKVIDDIAGRLDIRNIQTTHTRVEQLKGNYDFIVSRAVAESSMLIQWTKHLLSVKQQHEIANGWLFLKGGDLTEELSKVPTNFHQEVMEIYNWFHEDFFRTKVLVYLYPKSGKR